MDGSCKPVEFKVLRRWNSFTPMMPPTDSGPGGGYFVRWRNKGLVIDPGFDFISNFKTNHSLADISGVVVTHSHVDHARDLEALFIGKHVRVRTLGRKKEEPLDVFVSLDTFFKYGPLITSQDREVVNLKSLRVLTPDSRIGLPSDYGVTLRVVHADHESRESPWAVHGVGLVLAFSEGDTLIGSIGLAGDSRMTRRYAREFADCDIVIGHLGTLDLAELITMARPGGTDRLQEELANWKESGTSVFKPGEEELFRSLVKGLPPDPCDIPAHLLNLLRGQGISSRPRTYSAHSLFKGMSILFDATLQSGSGTVGVISEYGLELSSFRHEVAEVLNQALSAQRSGGTVPSKTIMTGDIGLNLQLWKDPQACDRRKADAVCKQCPTDSPAVSRVTVSCNDCHLSVPPWCIVATCVRFREKAMRYRCPFCSKYEFYPHTPLIQ
jgi:hypothetical protein